MSTYNAADILCVSIARRLTGARNCFHGVASNIPLTAILLAKRLYAPEMNYLNITGGVNVAPVISEVSTDGYSLFEDSRGIFTLTDIFDLAARGGLDVAFLSGGQVDKKARINNSVIGDFHRPKVKLPGGAGSAVLVPNAKRAFIWKSKHEKRGFVEEVDFVTSTGNVQYVFSPLCTFEKINGKLELIERMPKVSMEEIRDNTGFDIKAATVPEMAPPTQEELAALNQIDPQRIRDIEL